MTIATAFFCLLRHIVDCLNLLNVNRKEIDSQGALTETATNTAFVLIVSYQVCMMAFFSVNNLQSEALVCTILFIISIFYIVLSYKNVHEIESTGETTRNWLLEIQDDDN